MGKPTARKVVRAAVDRQAGKRVNVTFRLPERVLARFRAFAKGREITMTELVEQFIRDCIAMD